MTGTSLKIDVEEGRVCSLAIGVIGVMLPAQIGLHLCNFVLILP